MATQTSEEKIKKAHDPVAVAAALEAEGEWAAEPIHPAIAATDAPNPMYDDPMAKLAAASGISDPDALALIVERATVQLTAAHKAEMTALRTEIEQIKDLGETKSQQINNESMGGYPWQYYKFPQTWVDTQRRGWMTMGPGGASPKDGHRDTGSFALYLKKGFIPITKYGLCPVPVSPKVDENYAEFVKRGGWVEFPASQIVAYQWHRHNPFIHYNVRWQQMDAILDKLQSWTCDACGFSLDFMPDDPLVGSAYRQHLVNSDKLPYREAIEIVKSSGFTVTPYRVRSIADAISMNKPD